MSSPSAAASSDARALDTQVISREDAEDEEYRQFMTEEANKARHEVSGATKSFTFSLLLNPSLFSPPPPLPFSEFESPTLARTL